MKKKDQRNTKSAFRETAKFLLSEVKQPDRKKVKQLIRCDPQR